MKNIFNAYFKTQINNGSDKKWVEMKIFNSPLKTAVSTDNTKTPITSNTLIIKQEEIETVNMPARPTPKTLAPKTNRQKMRELAQILYNASYDRSEETLKLALAYLLNNKLDASKNFDFTARKKNYSNRLDLPTETTLYKGTTLLHLLATAIQCEPNYYFGHQAYDIDNDNQINIYCAIFAKLIEYGANVNAINYDRTPVLIEAVRWSPNYVLLKLLLENGANPHCRDWNKQSVLDIAEYKYKGRLIIYASDIPNQDQLRRDTHGRLWNVLDKYYPEQPQITPSMETPSFRYM